VASLAEIFVYLNFRYLVVALALNIVSSESFTQHELPLPAVVATHFLDDQMEKALSGV
jgi:hypothetical protein